MGHLVLELKDALLDFFDEVILYYSSHFTEDITEENTNLEWGQQPFDFPRNSIELSFKDLKIAEKGQFDKDKAALGFFEDEKDEQQGDGIIDLNEEEDGDYRDDGFIDLNEGEEYKDETKGQSTKQGLKCSFLTIHDLQKYGVDSKTEFLRLSGENNKFKFFQYQLNSLKMEEKQENFIISHTGIYPENQEITMDYSKEDTLIVDCRILPREHNVNSYFNPLKNAEEFIKAPFVPSPLSYILLGNGPTSLWVAEILINHNQPFMYNKSFSAINFLRLSQNIRNNKVIEHIKANPTIVAEHNKPSFTLKQLLVNAQDRLLAIDEEILKYHPNIEDLLYGHNAHDCWYIESKLEVYYRTLEQRRSVILANKLGDKIGGPFTILSNLVNSFAIVIENFKKDPFLGEDQYVVMLKPDLSFYAFGRGILCIGYKVNRFEGIINENYKLIANAETFPNDICPVSVDGSVFHKFYRGCFLLRKIMGSSREELLKSGGLKKLFLIEEEQKALRKLLNSQGIPLDDHYFTLLLPEARNFYSAPSIEETIKLLERVYNQWSQGKEEVNEELVGNFVKIMQNLLEEG